MVCLNLWSDSRISNREVGELSQNHGLTKAGITAQAFYEKVAKEHQLGFADLQCVDPYTVCCFPHAGVRSIRLILVVSPWLIS